MNIQDFRLLYEFDAWANHRTLEACAALSEEQFTRDLGNSFRSDARHALPYLRRGVDLARALARPRAHRASQRRRLSESRSGPPPLGGNRARHASTMSHRLFPTICSA